MDKEKKVIDEVGDLNKRIGVSNLLLSAILIDNDILPEVKKKLKASDFQTMAQQEIYEAMLCVYGCGIDINLINLSAFLEDKDNKGVYAARRSIEFKFLRDDISEITSDIDHQLLIDELKSDEKLSYSILEPGEGDDLDEMSISIIEVADNFQKCISALCQAFDEMASLLLSLKLENDKKENSN